MDANSFHLVTRQHAGKPVCKLEKFSLEQAKTVREFHQSFPMYAPTPLPWFPSVAVMKVS